MFGKKRISKDGNGKEELFKKGSIEIKLEEA
jgi:hypothetical protein